MTNANSSTILNVLPDPLPKISKPSSRFRRARPRRRVQSDIESDAADSDRGSLTDASSGSDEDDDTDDEVDTPSSVSKPVGPGDATPKDGKNPPSDDPSSTPVPPASTTVVFADTTPLVWADLPPDAKVEEVIFEDVSTRGRGRGRGGARGGAPGERKELTEEGKRKLAEKRERKKEKLKAKRKAEKEAKALAKKEAGAGAKPKQEAKAGAKAKTEPKAEVKAEDDGGWGGGPIQPSEDKVSASESQPVAEAEDGGWGVDAPSRAAAERVANSLEPDDGGWGGSQSSKPTPTPSTRPQQPRPTRQFSNNERNGNHHNGANDLGNVPRTGGMWAQDQRYPGSGEGYGRGRGGFRGQPQQFRGERGTARGFRGRGRGFGPTNGSFGHHISQPMDGGLAANGWNGESSEAARAKANGTPKAVKGGDAEQGARSEQSTGRPMNREGGSWRRGGSEQVARTEQDQAAYGGVPRGRGGARGFMGRGAYAQSRPSPNHITLPPPSSATSHAADEHTPRPAVEDLLPATSGVTVHLPGSKQSINVPLKTPTPAEIPTPAETPRQPSQPTPTAAAPTQPNGQSLPSHPIANPTPLPLHLTGGSNQSPSPFTPRSENGSNSSSNFAPPPTFLPPGIGMTPNGEYYNVSNGAPVDFHPAPYVSERRGRGRPYYPGSANGHRSTPYNSQYPPAPSPQMYYDPTPTFDPSFRPDSPYGSPFPAPAQLGYFVPPAPSKRVSIRDPSAPDAVAEITSPNSKAKSSTFVASYQPAQDQPYYAQAYNPYAQGQGMDMGEMQYGYGWQGQAPADGQGYTQADYTYGY